LERVICYDPHSCFWREIEEYFAGKGVRLPVAVEIDSLESSKIMVMQNRGIAFMPCLSLEEDISQHRICPVNFFPSPNVERGIYLSYRKNINPRKLTYVDMLNDYLAAKQKKNE